MQESDRSWQPEIYTQAQRTASTFRGIRWMAAGLALAIVALVFHTSGRFAAGVRGATRQWMRETWTLARDGKRLGRVVGIPFLKSVHTAAPPVSSRWIPPVANGSLTQGFGWHGRGSTAKFVPEMVARVASSSPVLSGVQGRVDAVSRDSVGIVANGYHIRFSGIKPMVGVHQLLTPETRIGTTASHTLTIQVTKDGYPVDPLLSTLYGTRWMRH